MSKLWKAMKIILPRTISSREIGRVALGAWKRSLLLAVMTFVISLSTGWHGTLLHADFKPSLVSPNDASPRSNSFVAGFARDNQRSARVCFCRVRSSV